MPKRNRQDEPETVLIDALRHVVKGRQPVNLQEFSEAFDELLEKDRSNWVAQLKGEVLRQLDENAILAAAKKFERDIQSNVDLARFARMKNCELRAYLKENRAHRMFQVLESLKGLIRNMFGHHDPIDIDGVRRCFPQRWTLDTPTEPHILLCGLSDEMTKRLMWNPPASVLSHVENEGTHAVARRITDLWLTNRVAVVVGESGAGKTHVLLTSNPNGLTVVLDPGAEEVVVDLAASSISQLVGSTEPLASVARLPACEQWRSFPWTQTTRHLLPLCWEWSAFAG